MTVHLWRFEVLDRENIMRTGVSDCQATRGARLLAATRRALVEPARARFVSPSFQREFGSMRGDLRYEKGDRGFESVFLPPASQYKPEEMDSNSPSLVQTSTS
jgi:hypothetical protein